MNNRQQRTMSVLLALFLLAPAGWVGPVSAAAAETESSWQMLSAGQEEARYTFEYAGDGSQIEIRLEVEPAGALGFVLWTPAQIEKLQRLERTQPIGRGSSDSRTPGVLTWAGNFKAAGAYDVVVQRDANTKGAVYYHLSVLGEGVDFSGEASTASAELETTPTTTTPLVIDDPITGLSGKLVFQTTYGGPFYTINVDGSYLQRITNGIDPVWSPDGAQIAFVRWEEPRGVWVISADGSHERRVFDWSETRYPSWSPDGQEILFAWQKGSSKGAAGGFPFAEPVTSYRRGGPPGGGRPPSSSSSHWALGVVNVTDGSFWEPLPISETNSTADWSADGSSVVLVGARGLMGQSVDGQESWQLTTSFRDTTPVWSPDGAQVAFVHRQHDHWEIWRLDVSTGVQTRVTTTPAMADGAAADSVAPAWSPDGQYIAFLTNRTGRWEIWVMNADGSNQQPLFDNELAGLSLQYAYANERALDWVQ